MSNITPINSTNFDAQFKNFEYGVFPWDHVPEGTYQASFHTWITYRYHSDRMVMIFSITDSGKHFGTYIPAFYGVKNLIGKPSVQGKFCIQSSGYLLRSLRRMVPELPRKFRLDRFSMKKLYRNMYQIKVVDVKHDQEGGKYDENEVYSKVKGYQIKVV